jgi:hypothetical protein
LSTHHTRPLNSLKNVLSEQARVYRSVVNGALTAIEGVRLSFILREVRCTLEAVAVEAAAAAAAEAAAAANAAASVPLLPVSYTIVTIPTGHSVIGDHVVPNEDANALRLEHTLAPEEVAAAAAEIVITEPEPACFQEPAAQLEPAAPEDDDDDNVSTDELIRRAGAIRLV